MPDDVAIVGFDGIEDTEYLETPISTVEQPTEAMCTKAWEFLRSRLQEPRIQHKAACAAAGIEGLTLHGLRRSFGTLSEWVECPVGIVAQLQGHKPSATAEKHYRRRPVDLLRLWHTRIEGWILREAGIEQSAAEQAPALRVVA